MGMMRQNDFSIYGVAVVAIVLAAMAISAGCSDPGRYDEGNIVVFGRLKVFESTTAPSMTDPRDDIWDNVRIGAIVVGEDSAYTDYSGQRTVNMQAIIAQGRLYLRAEWYDGTRSISPREISHLRDTLYDVLDVDTIWDVCDTLVHTGCNQGDSIIISIDTAYIDTVVTALWVRQPAFIAGAGDTARYDQDRLAIIWDVGDNGDYAAGGEASDCRSMCHAVEDLSPLNHRMYTTGGGHVDVWHWQAGTTDPVLMARDEYWSDQGREFDQYTQRIADTNWNDFEGKPRYSHLDDSAFTGTTLLIEEAHEFSDTIDYPNTYEMPGYVLHGEVLGSGVSIGDISAFSTFSRNSILGGRWQVLMSRALTTPHGDDIDFSSIATGDSVVVTLAVGNAAGMLHSGSQPFYIIFP